MKHDGKVVISTLLDNSGLKKGIGNISGSLGGLKGVVSKLGAAIGVAFSVAAVVNFGKESSKAAMQLSDALTGLQSILEGQGRSFTSARAFIEEYIKDGLIPATNAITAYKNLAMRGYDDSQIRQVMIALKDASAYGRQASYTMGEAVESASEGLKNENSILVDNAGVTKNVAKMWEEYAASIGTTASNLTQQQKIQAEVAGILEESKYQTGDAAKVAGTLSGQLQQLSFNFNNLKIAVGNVINPIAQSFLPVINSAITTITRFVNTLAAAMSIIFGKVSVQTESIAKSATEGAEAEEALAKGIGGAGKAAKKSLAGFDELNTLQSNTAGGGSGVGGPGGDSSSKTVASSEIGEGIITKEAERIAQIIKEIAGYVPVIAAGLAGLKLGNFLSELLTANIETKTLKEALALLGKKTLITLEIGLMIGGIALFGKGIGEAFKEGVDGVNFAEILGGGALGAGAATALGSQLATWISTAFAGSAVDLAITQVGINLGVGTAGAAGAAMVASVAGIILGIPTMIAGIHDAIVSGIEWLNAALVGIGATAAGAGIGAIIGMLGGPIGAGVGALIGLVIGLLTDFGIWFWQKFDEIEAWFEGLPVWGKSIVLGVIGGMGVIPQFIIGIIAAVKKWDEIKAFAKGVWESISSFVSTCWDNITEYFSPAVEWFSALFNSVRQTISDIFYNIGVIASGCWEVIKVVWGIVSSWFNENVVQPVAGFFTTLWDDFVEKARTAWEGVKTVFGKVASFFSETFQKAWAGIVKVFSVAGEIFNDIKDGILTAFKSIVNGLIKGLNSAIAVPFNGINTALRKIRDINIAGLSPFSALKTVSVPSIPYLAQGAVLPANKPFMAVVGDQKHGTNVEAPLSVIQEAVAVTMQDHLSATLAAAEAIIARQEKILAAIEGIEIGDATIGEAALRYNRKMAVVRG